MPYGVWTRTKPDTTVRISDYEDIVLKDNNIYLKALKPGGGYELTNVSSVYTFCKEMFTTNWKEQMDEQISKSKTSLVR
jgi:hypothetical protein